MAQPVYTVTPSPATYAVEPWPDAQPAPQYGGTGILTLTGTVSAFLRQFASGAGSLGVTGTASGFLRQFASGGGTLGLTGTAAGFLRQFASGSTTISLTGTASGTVADSVPTTNLIGRYIAGVGLTYGTGSLIAQWDDQSGAGNHLVQATGSLQPTDTVDAAGTPIVRIPRVDGSTATRTMSTSGPTIDVRSITFWIIERHTNQTGDIFTVPGNSANLRLFSSNTIAASIYAGSRSSTLKISMNRSLAGTVTGGSPSTQMFNGYASATATSVTVGSGSGFKLGPMASDIYEVLVYSGAQSADDIAAVRAYANAQYGVPLTAYDKRILYTGDSITAGSTSTDNQSCPFILANDPTLADWEMFNIASSGSTVQGQVDRIVATNLYYDATKSRNIIVCQIGRNDAGAGTSGADIYTAAVSFYQSLVAAGWEVWVCTCIATSNSTVQDRLDDYNALLRGTGGGGSGNGIITDAGVTGLIDLAADATFIDEAAAANTTYYSDGTHLTNTGNAVMAALIKAAVF